MELNWNDLDKALSSLYGTFKPKIREAVGSGLQAAYDLAREKTEFTADEAIIERLAKAHGFELKKPEGE